MTRTLVVARAEFLAIVRGKAFIIGVLMMPVLIGLSIGFQTFAEGWSDTGGRRLAVIDRSGVLYDALAAAASEHNRKALEDETRPGPTFLLERALPTGPPGALELELSERVRSGTLFGFVELPASLLEAAPVDKDELRYYTSTPSYNPLPDWLRTTVESTAAAGRFSAAGVDAATVQRLARPATLATLALVSVSADGTVSGAEPVDQIRTVVLPFVLVYFIVFAVMSTAPQMLNSVVEEKAGRISEVLLSSISPAVLLAGKLLGGTAVTVLLALLYIAGGLYLAVGTGHPDVIEPRLLVWLIVFLLAAVLMAGATFIAGGAVCSDAKDAQNLMQPVTMFLLLPAMAAPVVVLDPQSMLSLVLSMVPTATPFLMLARLSLTPAPPLWQVVLSLVLTGLTTAVLVWAAGRIFRVGLLMQGKPPNLPELLRWIRQ